MNNVMYSAETRFLEKGHFALETHAGEIAAASGAFLPASARNAGTRGH